MKRDLFIRVSLVAMGVLLALNLIVSLLATSSCSYAARRTEYKVAAMGKEIAKGAKTEAEAIEMLEAWFNKYGKEGWELATFDLEGRLFGGVAVAIFRR